RLSDLYSTNTHSTPISILMGMGLLGGIVFVIWLALLSRENIGCLAAGRPFSVGCASALVAGLLNSLSCAYIGEGFGVVAMTFNSLLAFQLVFGLQAQGSQIRRTNSAVLRRAWRRRVIRQ